MKVILVNHKTFKESKAVLELHERLTDKKEFPVYVIKGRKTIWGTPKLLFMKSDTEGTTSSPRNISTRYTVKFL